MAELNPRLVELLRTPDEEYAKLMGLSLEEYEVFCEMFDQTVAEELETFKDDVNHEARKRGSKSSPVRKDEEEDEDEEEEEKEAKEDHVYLWFFKKIVFWIMNGTPESGHEKALDSLPKCPQHVNWIVAHFAAHDPFQ